MDALVQLAGSLAASISIATFMPQAWRVWTKRRDPHALEGVSAGTLWLLLFCQACFFIYGMGVNAFWTWIPCCLVIPLALFMLSVLYRSRRVGILHG